MNSISHKSVLLKQSIDSLELKPEDVYLDATLGSGGHSEEVWRRMGNSISIIGIDADEMSVKIATERMMMHPSNFKFEVMNFANIDKVPFLFGKIPTKILFDLGWSSDQMDFGNRGFSFLKDEPLIMTLKNDSKNELITARSIVNEWAEESIADVLYGYGEEKFARRIAKAIVERRKTNRIETSLDLASIVKNAVPIFYRFGKIHPATKTFQAIRIAVNDELRNLEIALSKAFEVIPKGGITSVISFHSLEDRIVKRFFKKIVELGLGIIDDKYKKPIIADQDELNENPKSRSAKLRVLKKK